MFKKKIETGDPGPYEALGLKKDLSRFSIEIRGKTLRHNGKTLRIAAIRDLTEKKAAEESLFHRELELEERNARLEELNTALRVLIEKRYEDRADLEERISSNINEMIMPYLNMLEKKCIDRSQMKLIKMVEANLKEIVSPFVERLSSKYLNLTPSEIRVAKLVKHGFSSKMIAEFLDTSPDTIFGHRKNIRKKLNVTGKKANLRTHLLSLK